MKLKLLLFPVIFIILLQTAFAGVTNPLPAEIELLKGESGRFKFQIQAIAHEETVECSYSMENPESSLKVSFDEPSTIVQAGTVRDVYGTVKAPRSLDFGEYTEYFCVNCRAISPPPPGAQVQINVCSLPINVNVVKERTKDNMYIPEKPLPALFYPMITALAVILILIAIIVILLLKKRKREGKKVRHEHHKHIKK